MLPRLAQLLAARISTHVHDAAQSTNGVWSVDGLCAATSVLHDGAGDHDDILSGVGQLLDDKVDHLAKAGIFVLEEFRDAKEQSCGLVCRERLAGVEEEGDFGKKDATSSGLDWGAVEKASCRLRRGNVSRVFCMYETNCLLLRRMRS